MKIIDIGRTKPAISLKRSKVERKLLLTAYIKSYTVDGWAMWSQMCMKFNYDFA